MDKIYLRQILIGFGDAHVLRTIKVYIMKFLLHRDFYKMLNRIVYILTPVWHRNGELISSKKYSKAIKKDNDDKN